MKLTNFLAEYLLTRDICPDHAETMAARVRSISEFCGTDTLEEILTPNNVNAWLLHQQELGNAPTTVVSKRRVIMTLWRAAADDELVSYPNPRKIRKPKRRATDISCYTIEEVRELVEAATLLNGIIAAGVPRRLFWPAIIQVAWDTGLRRSDLWRLRRDQIKPDGTFVVVQQKTGARHYSRVRLETLEAIDKTFPPKRKACFPWRPHDKTTFTNQFRDIVRRSHVNRGTFRWLRRSSGTYVESLQAGAGTKHLGHANPQTFKDHYDCREISGANTPLPPALFEKGEQSS